MNNMKKTIIISIITITIIGIGAFVFLNLKTEPTELIKSEISIQESKRKLLIVGEYWPPMEFEEDGVTKGAHVDIVDLVMKRIGVDYKIKFVPWSRALKMVEEGDADALLSAAYTEERDEWAYYTEDQKLAKNKLLPKAYLDAMDMVFFIRKVNEGTIVFESFKQIAEDGYRVGLDANYAYADDILQANWNTKYFHTIPDNIQALNEGKTDMYLQDKIAALQMVKELGLEDKITYIENPVMTFVYYLPFSENSDYPNLKSIWKQTLVELEEIQGSGVVDEIYFKYLHE